MPKHSARKPSVGRFAPNKANEEEVKLAIQEQALAQGMIVSGTSSGKTLDIPPRPESIGLKQWLAITCCTQVWASVAAGECASLTEACAQYGWSLTYYYNHRNDPIVREWMLWGLGDTYRSMVEQIRVGMPGVIKNMLSIAQDGDTLTGNRTASVAAAKFLTAQLKEVETRLEELKITEGDLAAKEESRALAAQKAVWAIAEEQHLKLTRVTETIEVSPSMSGPAHDEERPEDDSGTIDM